MTVRLLHQPGPAIEPRVLAQTCSVRHSTLRFGAGTPVLAAVSEVLGSKGIETAVLEFSGGRLFPLVYVIPATSTDDEHAAWYSHERRPEGTASLDRAVMSYGLQDGKPFIHCHGIWVHANGFRGGGHLIPDQTMFAEDVEAEIWAVSGARLERQLDRETNFSLLTPVACGDPEPVAARAVLMRIKPNTDIHAAIEATAQARGIERGSIHGVCSLVDCDFVDGNRMESFASEAFIREGRLEDGVARVDIGVAAISAEVFEGEIVRGGNVICIASEILIVET